MFKLSIFVLQMVFQGFGETFSETFFVFGAERKKTNPSGNMN